MKKTQQEIREHVRRKSKRGILSFVFGRSTVILLLLVLQIVLLVRLFFKWQYSAYAYGGSILISAVFTLYLLYRDMSAPNRQTWLILVMLAPVVGPLLFLWTKLDMGHRFVRDQVIQTERTTAHLLQNDPDRLQTMRETEPRLASLASYMDHVPHMPVYENTSVTYFPSGKEKMQALLAELEKAERFIFLEYFILEEGEFWNAILEVLKRKAAQGVDVRVMYDGMNAIFRVPYRYPQTLEKLGIRCRMFSPMRPVVSTYYNNRDHRKIVVIDGVVSFTGGINLADEYIGAKRPFGEWKDAAVMLRGEATRSFTLMFLQLWSVASWDSDFEAFVQAPIPRIENAPGYVLPYGDDPYDGERVGKMVYLDIANHAQKTLYIMTPYLILDDVLTEALEYAAKRGVDVRIILPHVPDKRSAFALAYTHYKKLLQSGVRVFEFTPGFLHAKVFTSDGVCAVVGSINLDYRSLALHFECATLLWKVPAIADIEADFASTLGQCVEITLENLWQIPLYRKVLGMPLKIFAPLM